MNKLDDRTNRKTVTMDTKQQNAIPKAIPIDSTPRFHYRSVVAKAFRTSSVHFSRCHHFELQNSREICVNCTILHHSSFFPSSFRSILCSGVCLFVCSYRRIRSSFLVVRVFHFDCCSLHPVIVRNKYERSLCTHKLLLFGGSKQC